MFTALSNLRNLAPSRHVFALSVVPSIALQIFLKKAVPSSSSKKRVAISFIATAIYLQLHSKTLATNAVFNVMLTMGLCGAGKFIADSLKPSAKGPTSLSIHEREHRTVENAGLITKKLQKQLTRAHDQATKERDKNFKYETMPAKFESKVNIVSFDKVGICDCKGRRDRMEDAYLASSFNLKIGSDTYPIQLFGIFDGHGGTEAALYLKNHLENKLNEKLTNFWSDGLTEKGIWNALKMTFVELNDEFKQKTETTSGSTATVAMLLDNNLWTANVGDSRTILDNGTQLSEDAKPQDPYYKKGIENRKGTVFSVGLDLPRVNGQLALARAIGDRALGDAISARPKITVYPLNKIPKGTHLILACDGIYNVASTKQIATAVQQHNSLPSVDLAKNIVYSAYKAFSEDNLSAIVVKL